MYGQYNDKGNNNMLATVIQVNKLILMYTQKNSCQLEKSVRLPNFSDVYVDQFWCFITSTNSSNTCK